MPSYSVKINGQKIEELNTYLNSTYKHTMSGVAVAFLQNE